MRTRTHVLLCLASLIVAAPAALAASGAYVGGTGDLIVDCTPRDEGVHDACLGGHIFDVPDGMATADIAIDDDVTDTTGGYYQFRNASTGPLGSGAVVASGAFCDTTTQPVPADAVNLTVFVDGGFSVLDCGQDQQPAFATTGTIEVNWS